MQQKRFPSPATFLCLCTALFISAAAAAQPPKREFRAAWMATVSNIDWPSQRGLSAQQQKQEFINYLTFLQQAGFNAVIVQVRPAADALYESPFEPWSVYLSGKQGQPPFPRYDPLSFMIEETHKRNMEFHAWFNPFRALVRSSVNPNPPGHPTRSNPEWMIDYGGKTYFDPGNPQARNYILKVILDVVKRYDIDAVHIDDYFYPYRIPGKAFNDNSSYQKYNEGMSREDWRRSNVNLFISQLNNIIKNEKPWVKFGVSPFGIWRNAADDPEGSATKGSSCYDDLYSDIRLWVREKWVDYIAPQLYWECGHRLAAYEVLLPWWSRNKGKRHLYIGLGLYRMLGAEKGPWTGPEEILRQIRMAREEKTEGLVFYSISNFSKIGGNLTDSLRYNYFGSIAIPPAMPWIDDIPPAAPELNAIRDQDGLVRLSWTVEHGPKERLKFLVYRFRKDEPVNLKNAEKILALTQNRAFTDPESRSGRFKYVVTALDRLWNESAPSASSPL